MTARRSVLACLLVLLAAPVFAQTPVVSPTKFDFTASSDEGKTSPLTSAPMVASYRLDCTPTSGPAVSMPVPISATTIAGGVRTFVIPASVTWSKNVLVACITVTLSGDGLAATSAAGGPFGFPAPPAAAGPPSPKP